MTIAENTLKLERPLEHALVIEETVREAFPRVWQSLYYFDPRRGKKPQEEGYTVKSMICRANTNVSGRHLQDFENNVARAVKNGCGITIPFSQVACYLMTEKKKDSVRLLEFFGPTALAGKPLKKLGRLFEEYVARHELYHGVEMLEPGFRPTIIPLQQSERGADAYSLLSMFQEYGAVIFPYAHMVIKARDFQYQRDRSWSENSARNYLTQPAIERVVEFVTDTGFRELAKMDDREMFHKAKKLAISAP